MRTCRPGTPGIVPSASGGVEALGVTAVKTCVGAVQCPVASHTPDVQSVPELHVAYAPQLLHSVPPQSTSDSEPFFTKSVHDGAAHVVPAHTPD
jgi:hypothetical protein